VTKRAFCPSCKGYVFGQVDTGQPCPLCYTTLEVAEEAPEIEVSQPSPRGTSRGIARPLTYHAER
jgi:hypothetical protein